MFNVKADNGEIIATSQRYPTTVAAEKDIQSVRDHAADATVEEQTITNWCPTLTGSASRALPAPVGTPGQGANAEL